MHVRAVRDISYTTVRSAVSLRAGTVSSRTRKYTLAAFPSVLCYGGARNYLVNFVLRFLPIGRFSTRFS